jgi:hypothetical protein
MASIVTIEVGKWGELGTVSEALLRHLNDETHFPAVKELIGYFGGDSWLREYEGLIAAQGATITYIFQVNETPSRSAQTLATKMQEVFDKHWARVTSVYRTPEAIEARKRAEEQRVREAEQKRREEEERKLVAERKRRQEEEERKVTAERQRKEKEEAEAKLKAAEARKSALQAERKMHRQCTMCGKPLKLFQRLFTSDTQHKQCSQFTE